MGKMQLFLLSCLSSLKETVASRQLSWEFLQSQRLILVDDSPASLVEPLLGPAAVVGFAEKDAFTDECAVETV